MANVFGFEVPTPNITGLLSQSWIYVAIIIGLIFFAVMILCVILFFFTYNKKVELYENIGGGSILVRTLTTRARLVKVGGGGEELLKLLRPSVYKTAYGKKIAPNTYAFVRGSDGYWYNSTLRDVEKTDGLFDVDRTNENARMMATAVEKIIESNYNPNKTMQLLMGAFLLIMALIMLAGLYILIGKMGKMSEDFQAVSTKMGEVAQTQAETTQVLANAILKTGSQSAIIDSGLVPAPPTT